MATSNLEEKTLSANGWIAVIILIIFTFGAYYFLIFPQLVDQSQVMYYRQVKIADENAPFQMEANIPKNLSDFQESTLTLNIACALLKDEPAIKDEPAKGCAGR